MYPFIVATILARDEEDILEHNIKHHIKEGIEYFVFTNNGSVDRTEEIARSFKQIKYVINETSLNHDQSFWVTRMMKIAQTWNPTWIIHIDADELWCGLQNLRNYKSPIVRIPNIMHHLPINEDFSIYKLNHFTDGEKAKSIGLPSTLHKIAHRPNCNYVINHGNHHVMQDNKILNSEICNDLTIHHYPVRSLKQFIRKVVNGTESVEKLNLEFIATHWKKWYKEYLNNNLENVYNEIVSGSKNLIDRGETEKWITQTK